jgi:uncharacterized protein
MTQENLKKMLAELKAGLMALYAERLCNVYLFGSYVRGDQDAESDVDILIVLARYDLYSEEIKRTSRLVGELSLRYGVSISRKFVQKAEWLQGNSALLRNVYAEASAL